jgi:uncharacterized cupin superfamily protein
MARRATAGFAGLSRRQYRMYAALKAVFHTSKPQGASTMQLIRLSNPFPRAAASGLLSLMLAWCSGLQADGQAQPIKISRAQIAGGIFQDYSPVVATHDGNTTHDVELFLSKDRKFDAGMYRSGRVRAEITKPYGVNEYMHFIEGGVTLTSTDGTVTEIQAGDSVLIPADWTGIWDTQGYTKIYVIYSPDGPIEP